MRLIFRSLMYLAAFMIPVVLISTLGLVTSVRTSIPRPADHRAAELVPPPPPAYDASKPTVAVVLGEQKHEITDVVGPYAIAETGLYNVYFEAPLEDLARQANVPTAAFANKRLEYRADSLQLVGPGWPILLILQPVLIGGASVGLVWWLTRRRDQRQGRRIPHAQAA